MVVGDKIYIRTLSSTRRPDKHGNEWQYHSRSDAHSKACCWSILFDIIQNSSLLRQHISDGKVGFGINQKMHDYKLNRDKDLDLVVCRPAGNLNKKIDFKSLVKRHKISLNASEKSLLNGLPPFYQCDAATVMLALEAKACMTEHMKARPRLYDELASSYQTIHGDTNSAIAASCITINVAEFFRSPGKNPFDLNKFPPVVNEHRQPYVSKKVLEKVQQLPRRSDHNSDGYDAIGVVLTDCKNDGSEISLRHKFTDGESIDPILRYETMINRIAHIYETRFSEF